MKRKDAKITWKGFVGGAICRVQIFDDLKQPGGIVCIVTELPDNRGTSITNGWELLAAQIIKKFYLDFEKIVFVEHYVQHSGRGDAPETFDFVQLTADRSGRIGGTKWTPSTWETIRDRVAGPSVQTWNEL